MAAIDPKPLLAGFSVVEETYPNGTRHVSIFHGNRRLGGCYPVEGGFLVFAKRKPVPTLQLAAKQMIDAGINRCRAEEAHWRKSLNHLRANNGPIPPNTSQGKEG